MSISRPKPLEDEPSINVKFVLEDPEPLGQHEKEVTLKVRLGDSILGAALDAEIGIEHACGGVTACSTCHIYINKGQSCLNEADEDEQDRVEEAPGLQDNSRLSCQCIVESDGDIEVQVPSWNRNAVKEHPH